MNKENCALKLVDETILYDNVLFRETRCIAEKNQNKLMLLVWNYFFFKDASNTRFLTIVASLY